MTGPGPNADMAAAWDGEGAHWARHWQRYDRSVHQYHELLLGEAAVGSAEHVLDVGCGNGQTTRDAARRAPSGRAQGIDLSRQMIERARERAEAEGVANAAFEVGDAQVLPFTSSYDLAVSRFGAMFFADPVAAFANIGSALRPAGRLVVLAWRGLADNEWMTSLRGALAVGRDLPAPPRDAPGPLGLADPDRTRATLAGAGFVAVEVTAVGRPLWFGTDAEDAFEFFRGTGIVRGMLEGLDQGRHAQALETLRATLADHTTDDGVLLGSGAWLITARAP